MKCVRIVTHGSIVQWYHYKRFECIEVKLMKLVLPKEHGTWMMFFVPYFLGMLLGNPTFLHIPFLIGWFALFLASTPMLNMIRRPKSKNEMVPWFIKYMVVSLLFLIPVLWMEPKLLWLGLFIPALLAVNIYFIQQKNERHLLNDVCGIVMFLLGGFGAYLLGEGELRIDIWMLCLYILFYFVGSAFYVKSLIRERKNHRFKWVSHSYHLFLLFIPLLIGDVLVLFTFLPGVIKDWVTTRNKQIRPIKIGITEIANGIVFFVLTMILFVY